MRTLIAIGTALALVSPPARALDAPGPGEALVHALYETRSSGRTGRARVQRWSFTRRGNALEYRFLDRELSEHWRSDARNNVSHERIYHREATRVRYTAGDLAALGIAVSWDELAHVIVPPQASGLVAGAVRTWQGRSARRYRSEPGQPRALVTWLEQLGLPAEIVRVSANGQRTHVRLLELSSTLPAGAPDLQSYRLLDFADFGDMEYDPFVRRHFAH